MRKYSWFLGVVAFLLIVVAILNGISTSSDEEIPSGGPNRGAQMHPFATPLAASDLDGDANVAVKDGQGEFGNRAACKIRGPKILNICELYEKGPVVLAIFPSQGKQCRDILAQLDRIAPRFAGVSFAAVGSRGDRDDLRGDWSFPVGWDRDGAIASLYGLVGCPQITFARRGGKVLETTRREMSDGEIAAVVKRLR